MFKWFLRTALIAALVSPTVGHSQPIRTEFQDVLWQTAQRVHQFYFEEIPSDTLMHASARGLFHALDPASDYTFTGEADTDLTDNFITLYKIAQTLADSSFYAVGVDTLIRSGVAGMMEILDPYTVFMEKRNLDNFIINTRGKYGGLGFRIQVIYPDSAIAVTSLLHQQTPAARAGVRSGDLILAIDGESTKGLSAGDAADRMRGEPGTPVTLTLDRAGQSAPLEVQILREVVQIKSVPYYTLFDDGTGYLKLDSFQQKASQEVRAALLSLQRQGLKRLIFDLRGNGGGYLQEAVQIADFFLPKNKLVVFTAGRALADTTRYFTREAPLLADQPLVVLVDGYSASASEIVAGAIQDWDRGLIIGMPTVGKGSVQRTIPIEDKAELKLTMAAYFTPSGRSIDKRMRKDSTLVGSADQVYGTRQRGRIVRGGGGIAPDVYLEGRKRTPLYEQLIGWRTLDNKFFRFARQYRQLDPSVEPSFVANERTIEQFRDFLAIEDFSFVSAAEQHLEALSEALGSEGAAGVASLSAAVEAKEEEAWAEDGGLLRWQLTFEILEKAFGLPAAHAYDVGVDPVVRQARELVADAVAYEEWFLKPEIGSQDDEKAANQG